MNKIDEMVREMCPDGVEYVTVDTISSITRGRIISKEYIKNNKGDYPVYSSQTENNGELGRINTYDYDGEYLTWTTDGAHAGSVFFRKGQFNITNVCGLIKCKDNILTKFLYYYLVKDAKKYVNSGMGNPKLMSNVMEKIQIPLPPIEIQERIVNILDKFTDLTKELNDKLKDELTLRKKQYEYYRDALLDFTNPISIIKNMLDKYGEVEYVRIKDKYTRLKGTPITAKKMKEISNDKGDIKVFAGGKTVINAFYEDIPKANIIKQPSVIVQSRGIIDVIYYDKPFTFKNEMWAYTADTITEVKYLYYILKNNINFFRKAASDMGSLPQISLSVTEDFKIPLPPLAVQELIVEILDRFDALCNDLNAGLPAEIEARQNQYEYYRNKLLSFE